MKTERIESHNYFELHINDSKKQFYVRVLLSFESGQTFPADLAKSIEVTSQKMINLGYKRI